MTSNSCLNVYLSFWIFSVWGWKVQKYHFHNFITATLDNNFVIKWQNLRTKDWKNNKKQSSEVCLKYKYSYALKLSLIYNIFRPKSETFLSLNLSHMLTSLSNISSTLVAPLHFDIFHFKNDWSRYKLDLSAINTFPSFKVHYYQSRYCTLGR